MQNRPRVLYKILILICYSFKITQHKFNLEVRMKFKFLLIGLFLVFGLSLCASPGTDPYAPGSHPYAQGARNPEGMWGGDKIPTPTFQWRYFRNHTDIVFNTVTDDGFPWEHHLSKFGELHVAEKISISSIDGLYKLSMSGYYIILETAEGEEISSLFFTNPNYGRSRVWYLQIHLNEDWTISRIPGYYENYPYS